MKTASLFVVSVCLSFGLAGCFSSSSSSSGGSSNPFTEVPDDFDAPGDNGFVEEVEGDGTEGGNTFQGRRFFVEGGLQATGVTESIDSEALPTRRFVTIPRIIDDNGTERLAPYGVFYRTDSDFRFAFATGAPEDALRKTLVSDVDAGSSCLGPVAFDARSPEQTALTYAPTGNGNGNCADPDSQSWSWLALGMENGSPNSFTAGWIPWVGLPADADETPSWLVRDTNAGGELIRVFADDPSDSIPVTRTVDGEDPVQLVAISLVAELGSGSFLVAKQKDGEPMRLGHFDAADNTLTALSLEQAEGILAPPEPSWVTVNNGAAYFALQKPNQESLFVRADGNGVSIIDRFPTTIEGTDVLARPLFVQSSDTHSLWAVRAQTVDGTFRQVRLVAHGDAESPDFRAVGGYVDAQVRGHANGWMYFTVADRIQANGRLRNPLAVGINPSEEVVFILENAQWIGSSLFDEDIASFSDPATARINGVFFRAGDDLTRIGALIDPTQPLVERQDGDDNTRITLPVVSIGTLDSAFTAVSMGPGFGLDRLMTAARVEEADLEDGGSVDPGTDGVISSQIFRVDPRSGQIKLDDESGEDSLVRALSLF